MKAFFVAVLALSLAACQGRYVPQPERIVSATRPASAFAPDVPSIGITPAAVTVVDSRPYISDGKRSRSFEGVRRNAVGVVYPKDTVTNQPLATYLEDAVLAGFQKTSSNVERLEYIDPGTPESGVTARCVQSGKDICVVLILNEWQYDMMKRRLNFRYDVRLKVIDRTERVLADKSFLAHVPLAEVVDEKNYLNMMQEQYKVSLESMFNDPAIARGLKRE